MCLVSRKAKIKNCPLKKQNNKKKKSLLELIIGLMSTTSNMAEAIADSYEKLENINKRFRTLISIGIGHKRRGYDARAPIVISLRA